jgi:hypothetical protein
VSVIGEAPRSGRLPGGERLAARMNELPLTLVPVAEAVKRAHLPLDVVHDR